ncbi:MAG TPA: hypothetical protein VN901_15245 [Candidatus Acidoferrales bacterium]|nr:hypothetical protein [Candidatus Acidoferrales bacterium]
MAARTTTSTAKGRDGQTGRHLRIRTVARWGHSHGSSHTVGWL